MWEVQRVYPLVYRLMFLIICITHQIQLPILQMKTITNLLAILKETTEAFVPSCNITASKGHGISFNPLVQHAKNTDMKIMCTECNKPQIIYAKKSISLNYSQI